MTKVNKNNKRQRRGLYSNIAISKVSIKFTRFVIKSISKSENNLVMRHLERAYSEKYGMLIRSMGILSTPIRVYLENNGYISYASVNSIDRRIKYLTPTRKFPKPSDKPLIAALVSSITVFIRTYRADSKYNNIHK